MNFTNERSVPEIVNRIRKWITSIWIAHELNGDAVLSCCRSTPTSFNRSSVVR